MHPHKDYCAFFDVDETIIQCKSMINFLNIFYARKRFGQIRKKLYFHKVRVMTMLNFSRNYLNKMYYKQFKNMAKSRLDYLGKLWFRYERRYNNNFFNKLVIEELKEHKLKNAHIVLISGSFRACLLPIIRHLDIGDMLSTVLEEKNGRLTGQLVPPQTIGKGKSTAIQSYIQENSKYKLVDCYAYGDHISDIYMLSLVGHPVVVGQDTKLVTAAKKHGWKIIG